MSSFTTYYYYNIIAYDNVHSVEPLLIINCRELLQWKYVVADIKWFQIVVSYQSTKLNTLLHMHGPLLTLCNTTSRHTWYVFKIVYTQPVLILLRQDGGYDTTATVQVFSDEHESHPMHEAVNKYMYWPKISSVPCCQSGWGKWNLQCITELIY